MNFVPDQVPQPQPPQRPLRNGPTNPPLERTNSDPTRLKQAAHNTEYHEELNNPKTATLPRLPFASELASRLLLRNNVVSESP